MFAHRSAVLSDKTSFTVTFSGSSLLAVGTTDDGVHLFTPPSAASAAWKPTTMKLSPAASSGAAVTSAVMGVQFNGAQNTALVACSDGNISLWHLGSRQVLHAFTEKALDDDLQPTDAPNEVYSLRRRLPGGAAAAFATGGKDTVIRLYDEATLSLLQLMSDGVEDGQRHGHSAKVNALCWLDPHTLLSGGWDRTVQVWDTRRARSAMSIFGPYLCGEGLDIHPDGRTLITASTRSVDQLETWEVRTGTRIASVPWPRDDADDGEEAPSLLTARFSPDGKWLAAGGSRTFRVIDIAPTLHGESAVTNARIIADMGTARHSAISVAWSTASDVAVAGSSTTVFSGVRSS